MAILVLLIVQKQLRCMNRARHRKISNRIFAFVADFCLLHPESATKDHMTVLRTPVAAL